MVSQSIDSKRIGVCTCYTMNRDNKTELRCIMAPDQMEHLALKEYATIKLMQVIAERDAAIAERENALAERKLALSERDSAFLQRDIAIVERDNALMERDNAIAALEAARGCRPLSWSIYKKPGKNVPFMHLNVPNIVNLGLDSMHYLSHEGPILGFASPSEKVQNIESSNERKGKDKGQIGAEQHSKGRKRHIDMQKSVYDLEELEEDMVPLLPSNVPFGLQQEVEEPSERSQLGSDCREGDLILSTPIPYCSCTGTNQPCYRWGSGGWQSACCTTTLSMHPLPMNPLKKGYRLPGRKMSAGAFKKLVSRLAQEGVDLSVPIDLKNYWSKHGTNRYVTIK